MKKSFLLFLSVIYICLSQSGVIYAEEGVGLLPEDLAARSEMSARHKTKTIFLKESKPEKAVQMLNKVNDEYAEKGWVLFLITPYIDDEDFEGFFITYKRALSDY